MPSFENEKNEKNVCVKLCSVVEKMQEVKVVEKPKAVPKKEIKKVVQKELTAVKKEVPRLVVPVVEEEIEIPKETKEEIEEIEVVEELQVTQTDVQKVTTQAQSIQEENPHAKEVRIAEQYINEHMKQLVKLLQENLYYPRSARKRGVEGSVVVKFILRKDATACCIEVISSNSAILSRAAVQTIENLSGKFPIPTKELVLNVPILYDLKR